ncbi:hypothetical protein ACLB2K_063444 [Fragaria x ananassa]
MSKFHGWPHILHLKADPRSDVISKIYLHYETPLESCFYCGRLDRPLGYCPSVVDDRPFLLEERFAVENQVQVYLPNTIFDFPRFGTVPNGHMLVFPQARTTQQHARMASLPLSTLLSILLIVVTSLTVLLEEGTAADLERHNVVNSPRRQDPDLQHTRCKARS